MSLIPSGPIMKNNRLKSIYKKIRVWIKTFLKQHDNSNHLNTNTMAMFNYGVGGQEVKQDASEAMMDLDQNRTLFVQKLTQDDPLKPEAVYDLKTIEEVFQHFKPNVNVDFQNAEGVSSSEEIRFANLGDFSSKTITEKSPFLQDLSVQQEQYQKIVKQLKTNKAMQKVMENPDTKAAFLNSLQALIQELDETK
jgi:hypothetical protein